MGKYKLTGHRDGVDVTVGEVELTDEEKEALEADGFQFEGGAKGEPAASEPKK